MASSLFPDSEVEKLKKAVETLMITNDEKVIRFLICKFNARWNCYITLTMHTWSQLHPEHACVPTSICNQSSHWQVSELSMGWWMSGPGHLQRCGWMWHTYLLPFRVNDQLPGKMHTCEQNMRWCARPGSGTISGAWGSSQCGCQWLGLFWFCFLRGKI